MLKGFEGFKKDEILVVQNKICFENRYKSFNYTIKLIKDKSI